MVYGQVREGRHGQAPVTVGERRRLVALLQHTQDTRVYRRVLAVLAHSRGRKVTEIAERLQVSRQNVYNWMDALRQSHEVATLADAPRAGRPPRWGEDAAALLQALRAHPPRAAGLLCHRLDGTAAAGAAVA